MKNIRIKLKLVYKLIELIDIIFFLFRNFYCIIKGFYYLFKCIFAHFLEHELTNLGNI